MVNLGFQIFVFFRTLQIPGYLELDNFDRFFQSGIRNMDIIGEKQEKQSDQVIRKNQVVDDSWLKEKRDKDAKVKKSSYFYNTYTASIEIIDNNQIKRIYFKKPFDFKYLSNLIKEEIIQNFNFDEIQPRTENFYGQM